MCEQIKKDMQHARTEKPLCSSWLYGKKAQNVNRRQRYYSLQRKKRRGFSKGDAGRLHEEKRGVTVRRSQ